MTDDLALTRRDKHSNKPKQPVTYMGGIVVVLVILQNRTLVYIIGGWMCPPLNTVVNRFHFYRWSGVVFGFHHRLSVRCGRRLCHDCGVWFHLKRHLNGKCGIAIVLFAKPFRM